VADDPDVIKREIEETRERMGETVSALSYKADVPARARDRVSDTRDRVVGGVQDAAHSVASAADSVVERVTGAMPGTPSARGTVEGTADTARRAASGTTDTARRAVGAATSNPIGFALAATAAGFLLGLALPSTRVEDERIGQAADTVRHAAGDVAGEAVSRGREVAQETARTAADTMRESATHHASELRESAAEQASDVTR
jgi:hypothetical protein